MISAAGARHHAEGGSRAVTEGEPPSTGVVLAVILVGYLLILIDVSILMAALPTHPAPTSASRHRPVVGAERLHADLRRAAAARRARRRPARPPAHVHARHRPVHRRVAGRRRWRSRRRWMIGARAVQGIGAALLAPSTLALLSTSFPEGPSATRARWPPTARWPGSAPPSADHRRRADRARCPGATGSSSTSPSASPPSSPRRASWTRPSATPAASTSPARSAATLGVERAGVRDRALRRRRLGRPPSTIAALAAGARCSSLFVVSQRAGGRSR